MTYGEIPYAIEQGIFSREQRISPPYQGMPHEHDDTIRYALSRWQDLTRFLDDGLLRWLVRMMSFALMLKAKMNPEAVPLNRLGVILRDVFALTAYSKHAVATAFQGASRRFILHLGQGIRCRMMPVARYARRN